MKTLPDIFILQEMPVGRFWSIISGNWNPGPYEAHGILIQEIKRLTGANYRIAYTSSDLVHYWNGFLFQGRAVIYNADRLSNTTTEVAARIPGAVIPDADRSTEGVQVRMSLPCLAPLADCTLLDGDGRHVMEAHTNTWKKKWSLAAAAVTFELKTAPGKQILTISGHMHPHNPEKPSPDGDPEAAPGLRKLVDHMRTALVNYPLLIPPIIGADFNGTPELLDDFIYDEQKLVAGVDAVLIGKSESYSSIYDPIYEAEIFPHDTPPPIPPAEHHPHCGTISSLLSDHCAVFAQFLPRN